MTDRAQLLAQVFSRLRWCVGGEFSVSLSPEMCGVVLEALDGRSVDVLKNIALDLRARQTTRDTVLAERIEKAASA